MTCGCPRTARATIGSIRRPGPAVAGPGSMIPALMMTMPSRPSSRATRSTAASLRPPGQIGRHDLGSKAAGAYHQGHMVELVAAGLDRQCGTGAKESAVLTAT